MLTSYDYGLEHPENWALAASSLLRDKDGPDVGAHEARQYVAMFPRPGSLRVTTSLVQVAIRVGSNDLFVLISVYRSYRCHQLYWCALPFFTLSIASSCSITVRYF